MRKKEVELYTATNHPHIYDMIHDLYSIWTESLSHWESFWDNDAVSIDLSRNRKTWNTQMTIHDKVLSSSVTYFRLCLHRRKTNKKFMKILIARRFINGRMQQLSWTCQLQAKNYKFNPTPHWVGWLWNRRIEYKAIRSSVRSFARTAHSFACPALLALGFLFLQKTTG